ncbi:MAG: hypothetical protein KDA17_00120 [Candidatus Saccharibacteria bacterium]|nr:hypothetical protein [Candidatus Saccharibacteria bacterium]MCA9339296.1 hypothetical protein [Candidatus Saccharibacteria bacterium]
MTNPEAVKRALDVVEELRFVERSENTIKALRAKLESDDNSVEFTPEEMTVLRIAVKFAFPIEEDL